MGSNFMLESEKDTNNTEKFEYASGFHFEMSLVDPSNKLSLILPPSDEYENGHSVKVDNIPLKAQIALQNAFIKGPNGLNFDVIVWYVGEKATRVLIQTR